MKLRICLITLLFLSVAHFANAQGIDFFKGSFEEALEAAKKEGKLVFIDAYAVWCGPCKRMARDVFPDAQVGKFYNKNFVSIKMDMEKGEGLKFRQKYPVSAFPTLFYLDDKGDVVQKVKGARQAAGFITLGKQALQKADRSGVFADEYEKGKRDPEFIYNYIKALNRADKPSLKIANDYLNDQKDLSTEQNLKIIYEATTVADSKIFEMLIDNRSATEKLFGKAAVNDKILEACEGTVQRAIEFQSEMLLEEAIDKMDDHYKENAEAFEATSKMSYFLVMRDAKAYLSASKDYVKAVVKDDPEGLYMLSTELINHFKDDEKVRKQAEKLAEEAAEEGGNHYKYYLNYANILNLNGKKDKALKAAEKSKEYAKTEGPQAVRMVDIVIRSIEES